MQQGDLQSQLAVCSHTVHLLSQLSPEARLIAVLSFFLPVHAFTHLRTDLPTHSPIYPLSSYLPPSIHPATISGPVCLSYSQTFLAPGNSILLIS